MPTNVSTELSALQHMTSAHLREKHVEAFRGASCAGNKDFLCICLAYKASGSPR